MSKRAWVTLATNDSYGLGALVLAHSLRRVGSTHSTVVLITPSVTDVMRDRLRAVFTEVVTVDVLDSRDAAHLALLQRPELGITFTKIHCWGLTQYEKCVFLDADALVVQNCDELFEREELSAAPDVGWPDCFNSGVFVYVPSTATFDELIKFAQERGSFDGGDQGLLNSFFSDWARGDINKHLPFLYNVTSAAFYSYLPALKHYGQDLKIIHFIGAAKPWLQPYNFETRSVDAPDHLRGFLQLWWDLFVGQVHQQLDTSMVEDIEVEAPPMPPLDAQHYEPSLDPQSEFRWHHPDAQLRDEALAEKPDFTDFYDPWQHYKGNIPPNPNLEASDDRQAVRDYAWEYKAPAQTDVWQQPSGYQHNINWHNEPHHHPHSHDHRDHNRGHHSHTHTHQTDQRHGWYHHHEAGPSFTSHDNSHHRHGENDHHHGENDHHHGENYHRHGENDHHHGENYHRHGENDHHHGENYHRHGENDHTHEHNHTQYPHDHHYDQTSHPHHDHSNSEQPHESPSSLQCHKIFEHTQVDKEITVSRLHIVHHAHIDYENTTGDRKVDVPIAIEHMNGDASETESCDHEDIKPRHPYDNYYLKHKATIDSYGRKICSHEIPPTPSPSPSPEFMTPLDSEEEDEPSPSENNVTHSGVAGNLARVVPGAVAREALDELTRRQGWEAGNIDYMGADSFDNIWAKISQTLNQPRTSPPKEQPKQPSPPKEAPKQPSPPKEAPKQPSPPKEAPKQPSPPKEAPKQPLPPKEAPKQPSPPKEAPKQPSPPKEATEVKAAEAPAEAKPVEAPAEPKPAEVPVAEAEGKATPVTPAAEAPVPVAPTEAAPAPAPAVEAPIIAAAAAAPVQAAPAQAAPAPATELPKEEIKQKTDKPEVPPTPPATPKSTPEPTTPIAEAPAAAPAAAEAPLSPAAPQAATPEKALDVTSASSDSPPLANTPSKEDAPVDPAAKSEERERRKKVEKLQLSPPVVSDPLATPDSELEDAAALAQSIIASELTPTDPPAVPSPVSLAQIGVKPKGKSTAARIESSVAPVAPSASSAPSTEAPATPSAAAAEAPGAQAPAKPSSEAPTKSSAKAPATPSAEVPATPAPSTPGAQAPAKSSVEVSATPSAAAPSTPGAQAPATPTTKTSATPSAAAPATASAQAAAKPSVEAPATPSAPRAPSTPGAQAPATPTTETSATPSAAAPATPSAQAAAKSSAEAPAPAAPSTPSAAAPATPSARAPATPSADTPATPITEAPATPSSEAPATLSSEPSTPSAETPSTPTTPDAPKDAPKKKIIKKTVKKEGDAPVPPPRKKEKKPKDK